MPETNEYRISLVVKYDESQVPKIDLSEAKRRTREMIAKIRRVKVTAVKYSDDLSDDWDFTAIKKRLLKFPIDKVHFADVNADTVRSDVVNSSTVEDLANRIYNKYIPEQHKD